MLDHTDLLLDHGVLAEEVAVEFEPILKVVVHGALHALVMSDELIVAWAHGSHLILDHGWRSLCFLPRGGHSGRLNRDLDSLALAIDGYVFEGRSYSSAYFLDHKVAIYLTSNL